MNLGLVAFLLQVPSPSVPQATPPFAVGEYYRRGSDTLTHPASAAPIDDVAFFYFLRTTPLAIGQTYTYDSYYRKVVNPVTITVLKRERMTLPDGSKRECLVIRPVLEDRNGMFAKRAKARIWLTDDAQRLPVQIESTYSFGTVKLVLSRITLGGGQ